MRLSHAGMALMLVLSCVCCFAQTSPQKISATVVAIGTGAPFSLSGSEWVLEDLGGHGVIDRVQATLSFPETGKVGGNGSCNRFFGPLEMSGDHIKIGPLGSTRMACPEAVMKQETKYLAALQAANHFEWKDPYLLVYSKGWEKPLRFTPLTTGVSSTKT